MQALRQFSIPINGLKNGVHNFEFHIGKTFFSEFVESPLNDGNLISSLLLEKKSDHITLDFFTKGFINTECDRCTALIDLPIESEFDFIVKYSESPREEGEIIYILPDTHVFNVASLIYEQIILSIPIIKVFNCQDEVPKPCNEEVLSILTEETENSTNPIGDVLKNLKFDKNN